MLEFTPGEQKTAKIPMTNPTEKAFDYSAQLYMGIELAIMSEATFHLEAGESKDIELLVTMPIEPGTYPVNIGVFSNGQFIEPVYHAEDVTITGLIGCTIRVINCPSPSIAPPDWLVGEGAVAMFWDGVGSWVLCGEAGSWPFDMNVYRPFPLAIYIYCVRADGSFAGELGFYYSDVYLDNGKHYELDFATKTLREIPPST